MFVGPRDIFRVSLCFCVAFHCTHYEFGRGGMEQFQGKRIIGKTKFNASQIVSCFKLVSTFLSLVGVCLVGVVFNLNLFEIYELV